MQLNHVKTQEIQLFQVSVESKGVLNYRRLGPEEWEIQLGSVWASASGAKVLEAAYREQIASFSAASIHDRLNDTLEPRRLSRVSLSRKA